MVKDYLDSNFLEAYRNQEPEWGFKSGPNSIGKLTYARTYSRIKADGTQEDWVDTLQRVVNGTMQIIETHQLNNGGDWDFDKAQRGARKMFSAFYNMRALPPGRGLWMQGSEYVMTRDNSAPLNNCAFISTDHREDPAYPFAWLMDMSMLGVGVGFDTKGAGTQVLKPQPEWETYTIPDSREGWVQSIKYLLDSYFKKLYKVEFDYSLIRPEGEPIKGFGGTASGPAPLIKLHLRLRAVMDYAATRGYLTSRDIVDIMNMIGACVVAGNVRRSAELALGDVGDKEFLNLKNYEQNPDRAEWGWVSNNSIIVRDGDFPDYDAIAQRIVDNGEPGLFFLDTARNYGRLGDGPDYKDALATGTNPCAEQILEDGEMCNLVEVFPSRCDDLEEFLFALKYAYLYAKAVTLIETHDERTNEIMRRNRRIGTSISGVVEFVQQRGWDALELWLEVGYAYIQDLDRRYSAWLGVPESIRTTTVKPSGTVSLLAGVTPGVHYPVYDYYIRRIRLAKGHQLVSMLQDAGYHVEPDKYSDNTMVVELPVKGKELPTEKNVSIYDKARVATFMAENWSDNAVSCTITFRDDETDNIAEVLEKNHGKWKTVSFLPLHEEGAYEQMPYEPISKERYELLVSDLTEIDWSEFHGSDGEMPVFCTTDKCEVDFGADVEQIDSLVAG